jgi:hypothetical protein
VCSGYGLTGVEGAVIEPAIAAGIAACEWQIVEGIAARSKDQCE